MQNSTKVNFIQKDSFSNNPQESRFSRNKLIYGEAGLESHKAIPHYNASK